MTDELSVKHLLRSPAMTTKPADALVFFGATGDLAYKKIFPALQAMCRRGTLHIPVIGVAKAGWTLDDFRKRARSSVEEHGGLDTAAFDKLLSLLHYVDGDYNDLSTFTNLRKELGSAHNPAHYLAIPPSLFELVVRQLGASNCAEGGAGHHRKAVWARFRLSRGIEQNAALEFR